MLKTNPLLPVIILAVLFTALFHNQPLGLNLLIFESLFMTWILISGQFRFNGVLPVILGSGVIISGIFTVVTYSIFVYFLNFISLFLFTGVLIYPGARSILTSAGLSVSNLFLAQSSLLKTITSTRVKGGNLGNYLKRSSLFLIPLIIISVFILIYRRSNPVFDSFIGKIGKAIADGFQYLFSHVDFEVLLTFIPGLLLAAFLLLYVPFRKLIDHDSEAKDVFVRLKKAINRPVAFNALKNELRAGVFLILILNLILLVVNSIDIYWVWFNFEWQGQYLKQFVHEGTWLLILSILISIGIVLYFFRANLNFYSRNKTLKILNYIWLLQNAVLAVSVAIRNFWYIYYYALAYKRIGVIIFLIMMLFVMYTVFVKVRTRKTAFYLFRMNALFLYCLLLISSLFNWDGIIARYNFSHADRSFLHLDFLARLSDKTLPVLDVPLPELQRLDSIQGKQFPLEAERNGRSILLTSDEYHLRIQNRKADFLKNWESKGMLSWNLPEYQAYRRLKQ